MQNLQKKKKKKISIIKSHFVGMLELGQHNLLADFLVFV